MWFMLTAAGICKWAAGDSALLAIVLLIGFRIPGELRVDTGISLPTKRRVQPALCFLKRTTTVSRNIDVNRKSSGEGWECKRFSWTGDEGRASHDGSSA